MVEKIVKKEVMDNFGPMEKASAKARASIKSTLTPYKKPQEKPSGNGLELVDINANNKKRRNMVNKKKKKNTNA